MVLKNNKHSIMYVMKAFLGIVLALSLVSFSIYQPPSIPKKPYFDRVFDRLVYAESRGKQRALSKVGAVGLAQIMPIGLKEHNYLYKTNFTMQDMKISPELNLLVGRRLLSNMIHRNNGDYVKGVNSYNMGLGNTKKGIYYDKYLSDILMGKWELYKKGRGVSWKGEKNINLWRENVILRTHHKYKVSSIP